MKVFTSDSTLKISLFSTTSLSLSSDDGTVLLIGRPMLRAIGRGDGVFSIISLVC